MCVKVSQTVESYRWRGPASDGNRQYYRVSRGALSKAFEISSHSYLYDCLTARKVSRLAGGMDDTSRLNYTFIFHPVPRSFCTPCPALPTPWCSSAPSPPSLPHTFLHQLPYIIYTLFFPPVFHNICCPSTTSSSLAFLNIKTGTI